MCIYMSVTFLGTTNTVTNKTDLVFAFTGANRSPVISCAGRVKKTLTDNELCPAYPFHALCHFRKVKMYPRRFKWLPLKGHLRLIIKAGGTFIYRRYASPRAFRSRARREQ